MISDGYPDGVRVGDRVALVEQRGRGLGRAAEQRPVEGLEDRCLVLVRGDVVRDGHAADPRDPAVRMPAEAEQRHVAAPRPAREDDPRRIGEAPRDQVVEPGEHVLELEEADVPGELVAPRLPEADRTAVVDHRDEEAGVDVRLDVGHPAVHVERVGAAVHAHDHRVRAVALRADEEPVDALAVAGSRTTTTRTAGRRAPSAPELEQRRGRAHREQRRRVQRRCGRGTRPRHRAGRRPPVIEPGSVSSGVSVPAREVVAVEAMPAVDELEQQQGRSVGPPVDRLDRARELGRQVVDLAASGHPRWPGARSPVRSWAMAIRVSPGSGEKASPDSCQTLVAQLRDGRRRCRASIDRSGGVEHVAVLHDLEHRRATRRSRARGGRPRSVSPQPPASRTGSGCSWILRAAPPRSDVQTENPSSVLSAGDRARRPDRQPLRPALGQALDQRLRRDVLVEGGDDVAAGLGARRVVEPDDAGAVARSAGPRARRPGRR